MVPVDLGFRVAPPWLKVFDEPAQDGQTLFALRRNADETIAGVNEVLAYASVVIRVRC
jgi:hypothetical protein